jgi:hypothetical protein
MVTLSLDMGVVNAAIQILKLPLLILGIIILFRVNRILTHTERSIESIERTAENVERSSRTFGGLLDIFRRNRSDDHE